MRMQPRVAQRYVGRTCLHPLLPCLLLQPAQTKAQNYWFWTVYTRALLSPLCTGRGMLLAGAEAEHVQRHLSARYLVAAPGPQVVMVCGGAVCLWRSARVPCCIDG
jgi:hypothetical protein